MQKLEAAADKLAKGGALDERARDQLDAVRSRLGLPLAALHRVLAERERPAPGGQAPRVRAFVDVSTLSYFEAGSRCMLRMELLNDGVLALEKVEVVAEVRGEGAIAPAQTPALFPGARDVVSLWLVPKVAGFQELRGVVSAVDLMGVRAFFQFEGVLFRVGGGDGPRVSVVNINQRSARVVDNSRSQSPARAPARAAASARRAGRPCRSGPSRARRRPRSPRTSRPRADRLPARCRLGLPGSGVARGPARGPAAAPSPSR